VKRYHQELGRTKRVHRQHLREVHNYPKKAIDCQCELQAGRFRKQKALGCRKSRCLLCHYDKIMKIASIKDRIREHRTQYSLEDYWNQSQEILYGYS
jgi:hypothetical protein